MVDTDGSLCGYVDRPGARVCNKPKDDFDHRHGMLCGPNPGHTDHYGCHPFQPKATEATTAGRCGGSGHVMSTMIQDGGSVTVHPRCPGCKDCNTTEATLRDRDIAQRWAAGEAHHALQADYNLSHAGVYSAAKAGVKQMIAALEAKDAEIAALQRALAGMTENYING